MHWKILSFAGLLNLWISCSLSLQYTGWHSLVYMHLQYRKREIFLYCLLFHVTYTCIHSSAYWFSQYRHNSFVSFEGVLWSAFVSDYLNTTPEFIYFVGRILHTHKKKKRKKREDLWFWLKSVCFALRTKWVGCGTCGSEFILYNNLWRTDHIP